MTLIEILVVLAIIAIVTSLSVLAVGSGDGADGRLEAKRLEARLQLAADQAMIGGSPLALTVAKEGYAFLEWDEQSGEWRAEVGSATAKQHALPAGIFLQTSEASDLLPLGADTSGQGFTLTITQDKRKWTVVFDGMTARLLSATPAAS